jgi:hypothetical protein
VVHPVCTKWLSSLKYVRRKPYTYLASRLALSPTELNEASTWASSPRSTIGCVQNELWAYYMFGANRASILYRHQQYLQMEKMRFHMTHVSLEYHQVHPKRFLRLWYIRHKLCTYLALRAFSPRSTIRYVQNDFWAWSRLAQTVHLSCIDSNTVSEWTKTRFHMTHVT